MEKQVINCWWCPIHKYQMSYYNNNPSTMKSYHQSSGVILDNPPWKETQSLYTPWAGAPMMMGNILFYMYYYYIKRNMCLVEKVTTTRRSIKWRNLWMEKRLLIINTWFSSGSPVFFFVCAVELLKNSMKKKFLSILYRVTQVV